MHIKQGDKYKTDNGCVACWLPKGVTCGYIWNNKIYSLYDIAVQVCVQCIIIISMHWHKNTCLLKHL